MIEVLRDGVIESYTTIEEVPDSFDNLITFQPDIPEPPHTQEEHDWLASLHDRFKEVLARELR